MKIEESLPISFESGRIRFPVQKPHCPAGSLPGDDLELSCNEGKEIGRDSRSLFEGEDCPVFPV